MSAIWNDITEPAMTHPQTDIEWGPPSTDPDASHTSSSPPAHPHPHPHPHTKPVTPPPPGPTTKEIPCKHIGYRGYSAFLSSRPDNLFILRRFSALSVRVALSLQHELVVLERELDDLDDAYAAREHGDGDGDEGGQGMGMGAPVSNGCFEDDTEEREMLMRIIGERLRRYYKFIAQQSTIRKYEVAPWDGVEEIKRWHRQYQQQGDAIDRDEQAYLDTGADLIRVVQTDRVLDQVADRSIWPQTLSKDRREGDSFPGRRQLDVVSSAAIMAVGAVMLVAPIWILYVVDSRREQLAVITAFLGALLAVLSILLARKPLEALGATAVYAAVLMICTQIDT